MAEAFQTSLEVCPTCNSLITDEEFVVNWGGCGACLDESYEQYLAEKGFVEEYRLF
jgi:hypothetical protein